MANANNVVLLPTINGMEMNASHHAAGLEANAIMANVTNALMVCAVKKR